MAEKKFLDLLHELLPPKSHPYYSVYLNYNLEAIERGLTIGNLISKITNIDGKTILDAGCGMGGISIAMAKMKGRVFSLDFNAKFIPIAKTRALEEKVDAVFIRGSNEKLPFMDNFFDIIICNDVIEHVPEPMNMISEFDRALKPGGLLYLTTHNRISKNLIKDDRHYGLFGLTLMPKKLAEFYTVKVRKRIDIYDVHSPQTYISIKRLFKNSSINLEVFNTEYALFQRKLDNIDNKIGIFKWNKIRSMVNFLYILFCIDLWVFIGKKKYE